MFKCLTSAFLCILCGIGSNALSQSLDSVSPKILEKKSVSENSSGPATFNDKQTGIEFVLVKGGCYKMGSSEAESDRSQNEGPIHEVCVDDFWMGRYEVTNQQYRLFRPKHRSRSFSGHSLDDEQQPVVFVSWAAALDFTNWLTQTSGRSMRLPTEAEWEYAARGGTMTPHYWDSESEDACLYANVGDMSANKNLYGSTFHSCSDGHVVSSTVGSYLPNAFGLYDMLGNVWEWTGDWYLESYATNGHSQANPQGPKAGEMKVLRGGSWFSNPQTARVAFRSWYRPDSSNNSLGLRIVMAVENH